MKTILTSLSLCGLALSSVAQTVPYGATMPFSTYEAESPTNHTTGKVVKMTGRTTFNFGIRVKFNRRCEWAVVSAEMIPTISNPLA